MSSTLTPTTTSHTKSSTTASTKSTATNFGTCKASVPSTCKAFSTPKSSSTYFITRPTATRIPSGPSSSSASPTSALTNASVNHSGLTTGAKAGVGVGVAVGVIILLALLAFLVLFLRRRSAATAGKDKALEERAENGDSTEDVAGPAYEKQSGTGAGVGAKEVNS